MASPQSSLSDTHLAGSCGLFCGICPRYQSSAASRCTGCHAGDLHLYCSVLRCCTKKHDYHTCAECEEFACERLLRVVGIEEGLDSFVSHIPMLPNLERIREVGFEGFLDEQLERKALLEEMLASFNEGRSMTRFCMAAALLAPPSIRQAILDANELLSSGALDAADRKSAAKKMRQLLDEHAQQQGVTLRLRRKSVRR